MKIIKNILLVVGLFLEVSTSFAAYHWEPTGPTLQDIMAANKEDIIFAAHEVENLAVEGSREDKLIKVVKNGDLKNVETLTASVVDLEARDNRNMTALMIAARKGYPHIVRKLIKAGANIGAEGGCGTQTALFFACDNKHAEIVKILIANGAAKKDEGFEEHFIHVLWRYRESKNRSYEIIKAFIAEGASMDLDILERAYSVARCKCSAEIVNAINALLRSKKSSYR